MAPKVKTDETVMEVTEIVRTQLNFHIVGTSPLVLHAMSAKAAGELLYPKTDRNKAERLTTLKHEPYEEFRAAAYSFLDNEDFPTRLYMPAGAFHSALASVAVDMIGAKRASTARLTKVPGPKIPIWGIPEIVCLVPRSSDMKRTPDIRTLPILRRWCAIVPVVFVSSLITQKSIMNMFAAAGDIVGVGDGRPEKGKLDFGCWRIATEDDREFVSIRKSGGRVAQDAALNDPKHFDIETERLLTWFDGERERRNARFAQAQLKPSLKVVKRERASKETRLND